MGSRERVSQFLWESGTHFEIRLFEEGTKNSGLAAQALGCSVAEIAKSVVFVGVKTAVVIISGDRRVNISKPGAIVGEEVRMAKPDEVRERTGFPIGGVPPFPHSRGSQSCQMRLLPDFRRFGLRPGPPMPCSKWRPPIWFVLSAQGPTSSRNSIEQL